MTAEANLCYAGRIWSLLLILSMIPPTSEWDSSHITVDIQKKDVVCMLITVDPFIITKEGPLWIFHPACIRRLLPKNACLLPLTVLPFCYVEFRHRCSDLHSYVHSALTSDLLQNFSLEKAKIAYYHFPRNRKGNCVNTQKHTYWIS